MNERKYYVAMTDKFLSGWGCAEGRISKFIIACKNRQDAERAIERAKTRDDMKYINLHYEKPYYNPSRYHVKFIDFENAPYFQ